MSLSTLTSRRVNWLHRAAAKTVIDKGTIKDLVDHLIDGEESFLVWADVMGKDLVKELFSNYGGNILTAMNGLKPVKTGESEWCDIQARILLTIGDLCLKHNMMTVAGAKRCLDAILSDISRYDATTSAGIRYNMAVGIAVAKLSSRLKFMKDYTAKDEKKEKAAVEILRNLEI